MKAPEEAEEGRAWEELKEVDKSVEAPEPVGRAGTASRLLSTQPRDRQGKSMWMKRNCLGSNLA